MTNKLDRVDDKAEIYHQQRIPRSSKLWFSNKCMD